MVKAIFVFYHADVFKNHLLTSHENAIAYMWVTLSTSVCCLNSAIEVNNKNSETGLPLSGLSEDYWVNRAIFHMERDTMIKSYTKAHVQFIPRNMRMVLLCFALLWLCNRS